MRHAIRQGIEQETLTVSAGSFKRMQNAVRRNVLSPFVCAVMASLGIFGGVSALFVGIVCVVIHGLALHDTVFNSVGTVLLIAAIPMILIGSIFLDEIETKK